MTISTYTGLETATEKWMKRTDLSTDRLPEFVALAEARMWYGDEDEQYGNEPLRVRPMEASADLTISSGTAALPTGFLEPVRMYIVQSGINSVLDYFPRTDFWGREFSNDAGVPKGFTIEGDNVVFGSASSGTPKLLYYKKLDALDSTDGTSTNSILSDNPMIYLAGCLLEANLYIKNWNEAALWARRMRSAIGGWNAHTKREHVVGPLISRPMAVA